MITGGGTARPRAGRAVTVGLLALPLTSGLLLVAAPTAGAAVLAPGDGTTYVVDTTIGIRADHPSGESELQLTSPDGQTRAVARGGSALGSPGSLAYDLDTSCWTFPSSACSGSAPAPNGTYVVTQTGSATDQVSFVLRIPPAAPKDVSAKAADSRQVRLSWRLGAEPDLASYLVAEGGRTVRELSAGSCEAGVCTTIVGYDEEGTGEHTYAVTALRRDGGSGSVASEPTAASATLAAPDAQPSAGPSESSGPSESAGGDPGGGTTPGGTSGGTGGGTGGGSTSGSGTTSGTPSARPSSGSGSSGGGTASGAPLTTGSAPTSEAAVTQAVAQRKAFALSFDAFGAKLGIPKLPPLPQAPDVAPPEDAAPLEEDEFESTLGFEDQVVTERVESQSPAQRVTTVVGEALDSEQLVRSTAAALVLLLAGAHLRRWLAAQTEE